MTVVYLVVYKISSEFDELVEFIVYISYKASFKKLYDVDLPLFDVV